MLGNKNLIDFWLQEPYTQRMHVCYAPLMEGNSMTGSMISFV